MRIRLSTVANAVQTAKGHAIDGEVEDWRVDLYENWDAGDLPDLGAGTANGDYQTSLAQNGPRHRVGTSVYLGNNLDAEIAPQPNATATGDDNHGLQDDDGVALPIFIPGETATITFSATNLTTEKALIRAYMDWNGDGDFLDFFIRFPFPN